MKLELDGKLHEVWPTQQVSDKFKKRDFILEIPNGKYTDHIKVEATQASCESLDGARIGSQVIAKCNLRGRIYEKKDGTKGQINSIVAWDISVIQGDPEYSISALENPF